jgi:hypothetical protein
MQARGIYMYVMSGLPLAQGRDIAKNDTFFVYVSESLLFSLLYVADLGIFRTKYVV